MKDLIQFALVVMIMVAVGIVIADFQIARRETGKKSYIVLQYLVIYIIAVIVSFLII